MGVSVLAETCAHYLVLDDRVFARPDGHLYATCPQVKKPRDSRRLWQGLQDGTLCCVSTDTCSFTTKQKDAWRGDFTKIPMGLPGLETLLPVVYTYGVLRDRLSMTDFVRLCCQAPADGHGAWPAEGTAGGRQRCGCRGLSSNQTEARRLAEDALPLRLAPTWGADAGRLRRTRVLSRRADRPRLHVCRPQRARSVCSPLAGIGQAALARLRPVMLIINSQPG